MRSVRRAVLATSVLAALVGAAPAARAQVISPSTSANALERPRFEILSVGDSTFTFAIGSRSWVSAHARGDAVDPRKRNQLVARFEVLSVNAGVATALITGETTRVTMGDVALLEEPHRSFYRTNTFWGGVLAGIVAGAAAVAATK